LLFNFQGASRYRSLRQLDYYITSFFPCQYFFETFLKFFSKFFQALFRSAPLSRGWTHYTCFILSCQHFFDSFFSFYAFVNITQLYILALFNLHKQNLCRGILQGTYRFHKPFLLYPFQDNARAKAHTYIRLQLPSP